MKNKKNKFYEIIKDSIFKYLVYLIIVCLLIHLNEHIVNFTVYLISTSVWFLVACGLLLLILICVPFIRTKYKEYVFRTCVEDIYLIVCVAIIFIFFKEKPLLLLTSFGIAIIILLFITYYLSQEKLKDKVNNQKFIIYSDRPITTKKQDALGREEFVKSIKNILLKNQNSSRNEGFVLILSASWGEGKTSCINLLEEELIKENKFEFIDINPWFNDTKEKLLNAFFGELNHFTKTNKPYISLENQFDEIIKLSNVKLGSIELELDKFTENKNIQNKIKDIGTELNRYRKRIIFTIDDIDRLDKNHILYILQVIQMFKQYTNIIFILSYDSSKVEEILCESSESCSTDKIIYKNVYYKNYIERIASVFLPLPKIQDINIENLLFDEINRILEEEDMPVINRADFDFYISTSRFKTIRDIKRFCNAFLISYAEVKKEVNVFNYINITTLFVFFPEIYNIAWNNQNLWFKTEVNNKNIEFIKQYFKDITEKYTEEDIKSIYELIQVISPVYQQIPAEENKNYLKQANKEAKSYFLDDRYLQYYFTHNFSKNRIPDKILDTNLKYFLDEKNDEIRGNNILYFMQEYSSNISDFFNYLNIYFKEEHTALIKQIILIFAKNSFDLSKDFSDAIEYLYKIISKMKKHKVMNINNFLIEIIKYSSSVSFSIELYEKLNYSYEGLLDNPNINNILDDKILKNIEKALDSFKYEKYNKFFYCWLQKYYVIQASEMVDIISLKSEDYMLIKNKLKVVLPFIKKDVSCFMTFIGKNLEQAMKNYKDNELLGLKNISFNNFIYLIDIWEKDNILDMLNNFTNDKEMQYYNRVSKIQRLYKEIISEESISKIIKEHEYKLNKKITK